MRHLTPVKLFLCVLLIYFVNASGIVDPTDAEASLDTAKSIAARGTWQVFPGPIDTYFAFDFAARGPNNFFYGRSPTNGWYSKMGLMLPLFYLPAIYLGKGAGIYFGQSEFWTRFFVALLNALATAALVTTLFFTLRKLGSPIPTAAGISLAVAFCTYLFPYSKFCHREPIQALCLMVFVGAVVTQSTRSYGVAGIVGAIGILTKQAFFIPLVPFVAYAVFALKPRPKTKLIALILPLFLAVLVWGIYGKLVFQNPWRTGYSPAVEQFSASIWNTNVLDGIFAQWLSPQTGLLWYNPLLLILIPVAVRKKWRALDTAILCSAVLQTLFYAKWQSPTGNESLGPRYLVVILPVMFLWARDLELSFSSRRWVAAVAVFSFILQIVNSSIKPQQFWSLRSAGIVDKMSPHWWVNAKIFRHKLLRRDEIYRGSEFGTAPNRQMNFANATTLVGFNFWWLHVWKFQRWISGPKVALKTRDASAGSDDR